MMGWAGFLVQQSVLHGGRSRWGERLISCPRRVIRFRVGERACSGLARDTAHGHLHNENPHASRSSSGARSCGHYAPCLLEPPS